MNRFEDVPRQVGYFWLIVPGHTPRIAHVDVDWLPEEDGEEVPIYWTDVYEPATHSEGNGRGRNLGDTPAGAYFVGPIEPPKD